MTEHKANETAYFLREDLSRATMLPFAGGSASVFSARCPGKETDNEDAAALIPFREGAGALAIADGMGGHAGGALAASLALQNLSDSVRAAAGGDGATLRDAILNGFEQANCAVTDIGVGAATTLTVVEVQPDAIRPYHAGDSMILLISQRGTVRLQTISHSPVGYGVEAGLIKAREAMHHEERHIVSNMVGTAEMRIEIGPTMPMRPRDTLLLASDGLFDNLHTDEIVELARKGPLEQVMANLARRTLGRMQRDGTEQPCKPDDLSFIAFRRPGGNAQAARESPSTPGTAPTPDGETSPSR